MTNFLYCFDSNYNVQATVSISTLLEKYDSEVNLYILHDNPRLFEKYKTKLKKYNNLNKIEIYNSGKLNHKFNLLRRDIVDRNGELISRNIKSFHAAVNPNLIRNKDNFLIKLRLNFPELKIKKIEEKIPTKKSQKKQRKN